MRRFNNGISVIFRCCICSSTGPTSPCACMAYSGKRCCAPGRLPPRGTRCRWRWATKKGYDAWLLFLRDLVRRCLPVPLTITSDGAPGLLRAIDQVWPKSGRIRCWVHRMRNLKSKVPDHLWPEVKAHLDAIRDAPTREAGEANARDVLSRFGKDCPSLCAALSEDLEALLNHLRGPGATENTYAPPI